MRWIYLLIVILLMLLDVIPIPIIGLLLIWVILFRPKWFYNAVMDIYNK